MRMSRFFCMCFLKVFRKGSDDIRRHYMKGNTIQIHIRDNKLISIDRQAKLTNFTFITNEIADKAFEIFLKNWSWQEPIRSIGVRATDLVTADTHTQLSFFDDENKRMKHESLGFQVPGRRSSRKSLW